MGSSRGSTASPITVDVDTVSNDVSVDETADIHDDYDESSVKRFKAASSKKARSSTRKDVVKLLETIETNRREEEKEKLHFLKQVHLAILSECACSRPPVRFFIPH